MPDLPRTVAIVGAVAAFLPMVAGERAAAWPALLCRALRLIAAFGALAAAAHFAATVAGWLRPDSPVNTYDFQVFYDAARAARERAPLYDLDGIRQDAGTVAVYRHAPVGASILTPLTWLPFRAALHGWRLLNVAIYVATLGALLRYCRLDPRRSPALGLIVLWFVSAPSRESLAGGQWDALFLAASVLALIALDRRRDTWAGAALALPIALKFYPALLLLMPAAQRRYRALAGCAIAGAALTLLGLLVAGPANSRAFFLAVLPAVGGGTLYAENQTLYALIGRLLAADLAGNGLGASYPVGPTTLLSRALGFLLIAITALVVRRRTDDDFIQALRFVLPIPVTLLAVPTAWVHYEMWALFPLAVVATVLTRGTHPRPVVACFIVAALAIPFGTERDVVQAGAYTLFGRLLLSYKVYGLLALWLAVLLAALPRRAADSGADARLRRGSLLFRRPRWQ